MPKQSAMKRIIFFDTETNGLPKNWRAPASDVDNWPEAVSIAWIVATDYGDVLAENYFILGRTDVPSGRWSKEAEKTHGIDYGLSISHGYSPRWMYKQFQIVLDQMDVLVAHNLGFDSMVVDADHRRVREKPIVLPKKQVCTMKSSTDLCAIPSPYKHGSYKWPKLEELHDHLFERGFDGAHNALADVRACMRCYFEMKNRGVIA